MRPLTLVLKGINSFIEEQTIPFDQLTQCGLFGIFGPTGSGKSTILDGVTLALYDKIPRGTREFINKECQQASVSFSFALQWNGEGNYYVTERVYKRTKQSQCKNVSSKLYLCNTQGEKTVIADKAAETTNEVIGLIGLEYEDFIRSVFLPQGKFGEFLYLKGKERRLMLERLFHMEHLGQQLSDKIYQKLNEYQHENIKNCTKLETLGDITPEQMEAKEREWKQWTEKKQNNHLLYLKKEKEYLEKQRQFQYQNEKNEIAEKLLLLESSKIEMEELNSKIQQAILYDRLYSSWDHFSQLEESKNKMCNEYQEFHKQLGVEEKQFYERKQVYEENKEWITQLLLTLDKNIKNAKSALELEQAQKRLQKETIDIQEEKRAVVAERMDCKQEEETLDCQWKQVEQTEKDESKPLGLTEAYCSAVHIAWEIQSNIKLWEDQLKKERDQEETITLHKTSMEKSYQRWQQSVLFWKSRLLVWKEKEEKFEMLQKEWEDRQRKLQTYLWEEKTKQEKKEGILKELELWDEKKKDIETKIQLQEKNTTELKNKWLYLLVKERWILEKCQKSKEKEWVHHLAENLQEGEPCPVCGGKNHSVMEKKKCIFVSMRWEAVYRSYKIRTREAELCYLEEKAKGTGLTTMQMGIALEIKKRNDILMKEKAEPDVQSIQEKINQIEAKAVLFYHQWNACKEKQQRICTLLSRLELNENTALKMIQSLDMQQKEQQLAGNKTKTALLKLRLQLEELQKAQSLPMDLSKERNRILQFAEIRDQKMLQQKEAALKKENLWKQKKVCLDRITALEKKLAALDLRIEQTQTALLLKTEEIAQLTKDSDTFEKACQWEAEKISIEKQAEEMQTAWETAFNHWEAVNSKNAKMLQELQLITVYHQKAKEDWEKNKDQFNVKDDTWLKGKLEQTEREKMELQWDQYHQTWRETKGAWDRIAALCADVVISQKEMETDQFELQKLAHEKEESSNQVALLQQELKEQREKFVQFEQLKQKEKELAHQISVVMDLAALVKGNVFVEYLAETQLEYLAKDASKRLGDITRGRYALEMEEGEFVIRDDYQGGVRRKTTTLSGGEVFLVSFSLALALSTQIQLNNGAPLQFFFLDEGFGGLDQKALNAVMMSLERLSTEQLAVGVISHVEEVKERLQVRLQISPAVQGERGARAQLEVS